MLKTRKIKYLLETEPTGSRSPGREMNNVISPLAGGCLHVCLLGCGSDRCPELLHTVPGTAVVVRCNSQRSPLAFCVGKVVLRSPSTSVGLSCAPVCVMRHRAVVDNTQLPEDCSRARDGTMSITALDTLCWPKHTIPMVKIHFTV